VNAQRLELSELDTSEEQSLVSSVAIILILLVEAAEIFSRGTTIQNRGIFLMLDAMARRGPTAPKISCLLAAPSNISAAQSRTEVWLPKARYLGCAFNDECVPEHFKNATRKATRRYRLSAVPSNH
jgi:hypothetical protein